MPKLLQLTLIWSEEQQCYELYAQGRLQQRFQRGETADFSGWLAEHRAFAFLGQDGRLSVLKEARIRGTGYWYAYRTHQRHTRKRYLGQTAQVNLVRLEEVAREFATDLSPDLPSPKLFTQEAETALPMTLPEGAHREEQLKTILSPPPLSSRLLTRKRLLRQLDAAQTHRLTLLSAAAGWGKTTLLALWASHTDHPIAWLSLDALDNDPVRFWRSVIAALHHGGAPGVGEGVLRLLCSPQPPDLPLLLTPLLNNLSALTAPLFLILDDYHLIEEQAIHASVRFVLEHLPAHLHLVLSSRVDPPLSLSRLRVRGELLEMRAADLRFQEEEAARFLAQTMGLSLDTEEVVALVSRTEGWVAGLQLAALAIQQHEDRAVVIQGWTGSHRYVLEYIQEDILAHLPTCLQDFVLHTAILSRLSASLCQAVATHLSLQECQVLLEQAEHANLFLVPLDGERRWYRFHDLFREALLALLQQSQPMLVPMLHQRAARWYEAQEEFKPAIGHLLSASDYASAAVLMEYIGEQVFLQGETHTLYRWVMALPDGVLRAHIRFALTAALYVLNASALLVEAQQVKGHTQVEQLLARVEATGLQENEELPLHEQTLLARRLRLLRLWSVAQEAITRHDQAQFTLIVQQMQQLDEDEEVIWQMPPLAATFLQHYTFRNEAGVLVPQLLAAKQRVEQSGDLFATLKVRQWFALSAVEAGQLRLAYQECREVLDLLEQIKGYPLLAGYFLKIMAQVCYEWNQLEEARRVLQKLIHDSTAWQQIDLLMTGYVVLVLVELAAGDLFAAEAALQEAEQCAYQQGLVVYRSWVSPLRVRGWLAQGHLFEAADWAAHIVFPKPPWTFPIYEQCLTLIHVHLAQQQYDQAIDAFDRFREPLDQPGHASVTRSALALSVVALYQTGEQAQARVEAARLLILTEPEGYVRTYLDAGPPMREVLLSLLRTPQEAEDPATTVSRAYLLTLLQAFEQEEQRRLLKRDEQPIPLRLLDPSARTPVLLSPLTLQEQRVLRLLVAGRANREIAALLVVSLNTVKTHVQSVYRKLDVHTRWQASARARALHLL